MRFIFRKSANGMMRRKVARILNEELVPSPSGGGRRPLGPSRPRVLRLSVLFATDSFGGGFVVQSFIAYWLTMAAAGIFGPSNGEPDLRGSSHGGR